MEQIDAILLNRITIYLLVFVRMSSLFVITPVFGRRDLPSYLKIGLAFFCTIIIVPLLGDVKVEYSHILEFALIVVKEFMVGIILGYISFLIFSAIYVAGQIIDIQIGFGMVNILDPMMDTQVPLTGNFIYILTTLFFLMINGHHYLLTALFKSYSILPINGFAFTEKLFNNVVAIFGEAFVIGFKISIPVLAAALLTEVALGILSRTVPQMNVFVVGMPLKIAVGLLTLYFMLPIFFNLFNVTFEKMYSYIYLIINSMAKG